MPASAALPPALILYARNQRAVLPAVLASVLPAARRKGLSVLLVDDASTDGSAAWLAGHDELTLLPLPRPLGEVHALNRSLAFFPDQDIIRLRASCLPEYVDSAGNDWLDRLLEAVARHPDAGAIGVRSATVDGRILSDGRRFVTGLGLNHPDFERRALAADNDAVPKSVQDADSLNGDLVYYRRAALDSLSRNAVFDPAFVPDPALTSGPDWPNRWPSPGLAEEDLCFALRRNGWRVLILPEVRALRLAPVPPPEGATAPILTARADREDDVRRLQAEYWVHKWGWDPLMPDLGEIRRLYGHTAAAREVGEALRWPCGTDLPAVDLCMVTWNGAPHLTRCLASLAATDYPPELLSLTLVDNASSDATPNLLEKLRLPFALRVERLPVNIGGVAGMNWAMSRGKAPLVAKLDDDIIVQPRWLRELVRVFAERPFAGIVGPCIVDDTEAGLIQCAAYRYAPHAFAHEQERDQDQTVVRARTTHVRGCCNLYRRDALDRCGLLDIGYSPSQWDDPDHQIALQAAGYEVIYEGATKVAHKMTTGSVSSGFSLSHAALNKARMLCKWGHDVPALLDYALLLSREGRFVPGAGEVPLCLDDPAPESFPRPANETLLHHLQTRYATLLQSGGESAPAVLAGMARQLHAEAQTCRHRGEEPAVTPKLRLALSCTPHNPELVLAMAQSLADAGALALAARLRRRADLLRADFASLEKPKTDRAEPDSSGPEHTSASLPPLASVLPRTIAAHGPVKAKLLFCLPHAHRRNGELGDMLDDVARMIARHGLETRIEFVPCPRADGVDLVHFWTLDHPHETLPQMKALRLAHPRLPFLLSPLLEDARAGRWADTVAAEAVRQRQSLEALPGLDSLAPPASLLSQTPSMGRQIMALANGLLLRSPAEAATLAALVPGELPPIGCLPLPPLLVDAEPADPALFREASGLTDDYLLGVAPLHPEANQALLLAALSGPEGLDLPLVLVGEAEESWYLHACHRLAGPRVLFVREMDAALMASAFAGARVHALPAPGGRGERAALQAATAGRPLVVARSSTAAACLGQGFQGLFLCDPASPASIREALRQAWEHGAVTPWQSTASLAAGYAAHYFSSV